MPAILKIGNPKCVHYEIISPLMPDEHEIGTCLYCGRMKDYTVMHKKRRIYGTEWLAGQPKKKTRRQKIGRVRNV